MTVWNKSDSSSSKSCWEILLKSTNVNLKGKVRGSTMSVRFVLWGTWAAVQKCHRNPSNNHRHILFWTKLVVWAELLVWRNVTYNCYLTVDIFVAQLNLVHVFRHHFPSSLWGNIRISSESERKQSERASVNKSFLTSCSSDWRRRESDFYFTPLTF